MTFNNNRDKIVSDYLCRDGVEKHSPSEEGYWKITSGVSELGGRRASNKIIRGRFGEAIFHATQNREFNFGGSYCSDNDSGNPNCGLLEKVEIVDLENVVQAETS